MFFLTRLEQFGGVDIIHVARTQSVQDICEERDTLRKALIIIPLLVDS